MGRVMPARLNPRQDERSRSAIQTTQLCKRLNYFALGLPEPTTGRPPEMTDSQIRAALGLLRKTLPDLAVTQLAGADGGKLEVVFSWRDDGPSAELPIAKPSPPVIEAEPDSDDDTETTAPRVVWAGEN